MRGVDFILHYLINHEKVSHVFTYAGGTNAWLLDAISKTDGIDFIAMRHEENAAFAADGYARASGRLGVAATMSGPGATNLITGIADTYFDSVPVLFLTSQVTTSTYKFERPVRQLGYQETDIVSVVKPITKYASLASTEKEMAEMLKKSIAIAKFGRPGPSLLDIPSDIQRREVNEEELNSPVILEQDNPVFDKELDTILDLIQSSKRPVVLVGGGVRISKSHDLLVKFAEYLQLPVVVSLMGKDSFPHDHPLFVGFIGSYGNRYANLTLANCDLVIALGSRLDSRQTANPKTFARAAKKIHVDIDRNELNNTIKCDVAIQSDLRIFLEKVLKSIKPQDKGKNQDWLKYIKNVKADFDIDGVGSDKGVNPKKFLRSLSELANSNAIFLTDVGNNQVWSAQELKIKSEQRFLTSGGLGTMGFAIPAGIGAYFACPDRQIIAIVGDGGFQMSLPELQTIVHNRVPIKIIVLNNKILGLMWHFQNENFSGGKHPATEDGYSCPDVRKIAQAYGIESKRIASNPDIADGLKWLLSHNGPAILELDVHYSWAGYPKIKPGNPLEGQLPEVEKERISKYMLIPLLK
ncbi:MAG: thiamine pyrophosphate-binding protein [Candidatus Omnitrophica bacterium]|nr:thiamine pyrophosphate-binding protein [Candidatus Omnitrophota bacterium]